MFGLSAFGKVGAAIRSAFAALWSPASLFASSEVGAWYDPSDLTTMFQDSAGTTPVTADGQPVGLILDKSKGLALGSEHVVTPLVGTASGEWTIDSNSVKRNGSSSGNAIVKVSAPSIGWYKIVFNVSDFSGDSFSLNYPGGNIGAVSANGTVTRYVYVTSTSTTFSFIPWGGAVGEATITNISYRPIAGNHASQATAASRPLYKTDGTYHWLQFDGVDDSLSTAAINFTSTDKMSTFSGLRKNSSTAWQQLYEFSSNSDNNPGTFACNAPGDSVDGYSFYAKGATGQSGATVVSGYVQPVTSVLSSLQDLSGASIAAALITRIDGTLKSPTLGGVIPGGGNYGNFPLYIGARGGISVRFNGNIYSLITRGAQSTTDEITATETWVNGKTGAY